MPLQKRIMVNTLLDVLKKIQNGKYTYTKRFKA